MSIKSWRFVQLNEHNQNYQSKFQNINFQNKSLKTILCPIQAFNILNGHNQQKKIKIIDVRSQNQHLEQYIPNSQCYPIENLQKSIKGLDKQYTYLIYCKSGMRSLKASKIFQSNQLQVFQIDGGIQFWKRKNLPTICKKQSLGQREKLNLEQFRYDQANVKKQQYLSAILQKQIINFQELKTAILDKNFNNKIQIVDVRSEFEFNEAHIPHSISIPLNRIQEELTEVSTQKIYVIYCQSGGRSSLAVNYFKNKILKSVSLQGGLQNWIKEGGLVIENCSA